MKKSNNNKNHTHTAVTLRKKGGKKKTRQIQQSFAEKQTGGKNPPHVTEPANFSETKFWRENTNSGVDNGYDLLAVGGGTKQARPRV